jgi:Phage integrase, N-terminal SAM-like domain
MSSRIVGRGFERNLEAGPLQPMLDSFELHLRAEKKSPKTIRTYIEAAQWLAAEYLIPNGIKFWADVRTRHVQEWTITLLDRYSDSYANNQFRALQQFFKWHATEDPDEPRPNPMANLKPPKVGDKLVPVFTDDELTAMLATCKGGGFQNRRDYAVISLSKEVGNGSSTPKTASACTWHSPGPCGGGLTSADRTRRQPAHPAGPPGDGSRSGRRGSRYLP